MKDTEQARKNQKTTKKNQYDSGTQFHKTESDLTKKKNRHNKKARTPNHYQTQKSFLGAIQYFAKFIPNRSK